MLTNEEMTRAIDLIKFKVQQDAQNPVEYPDRGPLTEVLVAELVASQIPIPSSPVEDLNAHYQNQHKVAVYELIGVINETLVLDIDAVEHSIFKIWTIRYSLVYRMNDRLSSRLLRHAIAIQSENGTGNYAFAANVVDTLNKYPSVYLSYFDTMAITEE